MRVTARRLAEQGGPADVGLDERKGVQERAVDMGLGGEVDDGVDLGGKRVDQLFLADVSVHEAITWPAFELDQVGQVPRVGELVEHSDLDLGPRPAEVADEVRADEACGSRDQDPLQGSAHLMGGPAVQS